MKGALLFALCSLIISVQLAHGILKTEKKINFLGLFGPHKYDQCVLEGANSTVDVKQQIQSFGQGLSTHESRLRAQVENLLEKKKEWSQVDDDYKQVVSRLRAILKADESDIADHVEPDDGDIDFSGDCTLVDDTQVAEDRKACANEFKKIQANLVNFARAAKAEDSVQAIYWILTTLENMPTISMACINKPFEMKIDNFDDDDCEDLIEDFADDLGEISKHPKSFFGRSGLRYFRAEEIIKDQIPKVLAYCVGTEYLL